MMCGEFSASVLNIKSFEIFFTSSSDIRDVVGLYLGVFGHLKPKVRFIYVGEERFARLPFVKIRKNATAGNKDPTDPCYKERDIQFDGIDIYYSGYPREQVDRHMPHLDLLDDLGDLMQDVELTVRGEKLMLDISSYGIHVFTTNLP